MRYQLPPGITGVSVCGVEFQGDENGCFWVDPAGRQSIHMALQSAHGANLKLADNQAVPGAIDAGEGDAAKATDDEQPAERAEGDAADGAEPPPAKAPDMPTLRREILNQLASFGVRVDGRASVAYLSELLAKARIDAASEDTADRKAA